MKKRNRLLSQAFSTYWAVEPEFHSFMLDFLYGKIESNLFLAKEMRDEESDQIEHNLDIIGNTGIAYIPVFGPIYPRASGMGEICGKETTVQDIRKSLNSALNSDDIKGVIFHHDSPGGAVTGIQGLHDDIIKARSVKPVYAFTDGVAASADFWLYSAAEQRFADKTARLGSVGTVVGVRKNDKSDSYIEITNSLSPYKRLDIENEDHYKSVVKTLDDLTDVFYSSLASAFNLEKNYIIENFGKGGVKVGVEALNSKMFDEISSFSDVVGRMKDHIKSGKTSHFDLAAINSVDNFEHKSIEIASSEVKGGQMNLNELKANHPDLVAMIVNEVSAASSATIADLTAKVSNSDTIVASLKEENANLKKTVSDMEKANIQKSVEASKALAASKFEAAFAASSIPEKFKGKVEKQVSATSFIDAEGSLDCAGYEKAVSDEISEWESSFEGTAVAGVGAADAKDATDAKDSKTTPDSDVDATVKELLNLV